MTSRRRDQHGAGGRSERTLRQFTQEFKLEAVRLAAQGDRVGDVEGVALRVLASDQHRDHDTIAAFR